MTRSESFCSVPWFEVHINADGTYHTCGAQPNHMTGSHMADRYNVHVLSVDQWMRSPWQIKSRADKINGIKSDLCGMCYKEEHAGSSSKRQRENLKSQIRFDDFAQTWQNSPDRNVFENASLDDLPRPISYHISLGNECNLACRMCGPWASSRIASQMKQQGQWPGSVRLNWTEHRDAWKRITDYMCQTPDLRWVHVIGGEPLMNPRFAELIRKLKEHGRTNIYFGFTTNGTMFDPDIMNDIMDFRHVDIGISVECMGALNSAVRQGSDTDQVLANISRYLAYQKSDQMYITVRTVPSALSVHTLDQLYAWCRNNHVDVMSNVLNSPHHLQIRQLPSHIKERLLQQYNQWSYAVDAPSGGNPRDPSYYMAHIDSEIRAVVKELESPNDEDMTALLYQNLKQWHWLENPAIGHYFI